MLLVLGHEQQPRRVGRTCRDDDEIAGVGFGNVGALDHHFGDRLAGHIGLELQHLRIEHHGHIGMGQRGPHGNDFRIGLGVDETGVTVAGVALDTVALRAMRLVQHDAGRGVKGAVTGGDEVLVQALDAGLMGDRRVLIGLARRGFGGILAAHAVNVEKLLRLGVVGLQFVVSDRPRRRNAVMVLQLAEIFLAEAEERRAVHLGRTADTVVNAGLEFLALLVVPGVLSDVTVIDENLGGVPIFLFAREEIAAFQNEDFLA